MTRWGQPWERVEIAGQRCRLQILDPQTALEIEPELAARLGDGAARLMAAPDLVTSAVLRSVKSGRLADEFAGETDTAAFASVIGYTRAICSALMGFNASGEWLAGAWSRCVLDRFEVAGAVVEDARDWDRLQFPAIAKWQVLVAQLRQSFGPLWTRSPYKVSARQETTSVPEPTGIPLAVRYAVNLASMGHAPSRREILTQWTPVELIEVVESAAYTAAVEREAVERSRTERGRR